MDIMWVQQHVEFEEELSYYPVEVEMLIEELSIKKEQEAADPSIYSTTGYKNPTLNVSLCLLNI